MWVGAAMTAFAMAVCAQPTIAPIQLVAAARGPHHTVWEYQRPTALPNSAVALRPGASRSTYTFVHVSGRCAQGLARKRSG